MATTRSAAWHEKDFERWFEHNPQLPGGEPLLVVGCHQAIRRMVDLIALDQEGGLAILEVKNESSNRQAIGQALEYLSQYDQIDLDELADDYEDSGRGDLRQAFKAAFGREISEVSGRRRVYLVAPVHDSYSAVCTDYLGRHLAEGIIGFHLLAASLDGERFRLEEFRCQPFKRLGALTKTFAVNPRGRRLFYVIEPGPVPIVWNVGRWREPERFLTLRAKPSRKLLRRFRSHLLPIDHEPPQVDISAMGSVWKHVSRVGREATLIGKVTSDEPGGPAYVAFAEFRNDAFGTFRRRPAQEFHSEWKLTDRAPRPWGKIVGLAQARIAAKKAQLMRTAYEPPDSRGVA